MVKRDGVILEKRYCNEEPNITFFKKLIGVTLVIRWDAVLTIYDGQGKILFYLRFD